MDWKRIRSICYSRWASRLAHRCSRQGYELASANVRGDTRGTVVGLPCSTCTVYPSHHRYACSSPASERAATISMSPWLTRAQTHGISSMA
jgi:hypothetical protein